MAEVVTRATHILIRDEHGNLVFNDDNILLQRNSDHELVFVAYQYARGIFDLPNIENDDEGREGPDTRNMWSRDDILRLINLYKENDKLFKTTTIRNDKVWGIIAKDLPNYSIEQIKNKFKYLKSKYTKKKDNMSNTQTGAKVVNFNFFIEMDEIFRDDPNINPVSVASSLNPCIVQESNEDSEVSSEGGDVLHKIKRPIKRKLQRSEDLEEKRERAKQQRHMERMEQREEAKKEFTVLMQKLIDKL